MASQKTQLSKARAEGGKENRGQSTDDPAFLGVPETHYCLAWIKSAKRTFEISPAVHCWGKSQITIPASLNDAKASLARGEGRVITKQSMRDLAEEVKDRGRVRLAS